MHFYLLVLLFVSICVNSDPIRIYDIHDSNQGLTCFENEYSAPDQNFFNMECLSISQVDLSNSIVPWWIETTESGFSFGSLGDDLKRWDVSENGHVSKADLPALELNQFIWNENFKADGNGGASIVNDDSDALYMLPSESEVWFRIQSDPSMYFGKIRTHFYRNGQLYLTSYLNDVCTLWKVDEVLVKLYEYSPCTSIEDYYIGADESPYLINNVTGVLTFEDIDVEFVKSLRQLNSGSYEVNLSFRRLTDNEPELIVFHSVSADNTEVGLFYGKKNADGLHFTQEIEGEVQQFWYDVKENSITKLNPPVEAESFRNCNTAHDNIYCLFKMKDGYYALYSLDDKSYNLDSVYSMEDAGSHYWFAGGAGAVRIIGSYGGRASSLYRISKNTIELLYSTENSDNGLDVALIWDKAHSNNTVYILDYNENVRILRYLETESSELMPLVSESEFPKYRVMSNANADSGSWLGLLGWHWLVLMILITKRSCRYF